MSDHYRPIDCAFHDELELLALRRSPCHLVYLDEAGGQESRMAVIANIITRAGEEFMCLNDGTEVRLDRIVAVDRLKR